MITPQQILDIAEPIEEIYAAIVDELLINIGRHVRAPTWTHTADWEIRKLSEMGQLTRENAEIINRWIKSMPAEIREAMEETRKATLEKLEKQMERAMEAGYLTPPIAARPVSPRRRRKPDCCWPRPRRRRKSSMRQQPGFSPALRLASTPCAERWFGSQMRA